MQFSNFTRVEEGNKITFYTANPLKGITDIKYYKDNATGNFSKKEFRWSFNSDYWSAWTSLNQGNISSVKLGGNEYLFLEIRYLSSGNGAVTSFTLNYDGAAQSNIPGGSCPPDSQYVQIDKSVSPGVYIPGQGTGGSSGPIDAQTLCGKSCDYYLWRSNHKGQQPISTVTDLQSILNNLAGGLQNSITGAQNVPGGIGVFYDKSGQDLYFKAIDVSGGGLEITEDPNTGIIYFTVDASFNPSDGSINDLYNLYYSLESDLNDLSVYVDTTFFSIESSIARIDSSINDLYSKIDISTGILGLSNIGGEASIYSDTVLGIARLRTIRGTGGVNVYVDGNTIVIDASVVGGDSSIRGVDNIGSGLGEIFSAIDPSGIVQLRTLDGSGATSVITSGDRIIISTELTTDTSITNIANVGTGTGLVLAQIDSSGVAELRQIKGSGAISVSTSGNDIVLYSDASITVDPCTWADTDPISATVGGVSPGDTFVGDNAIQILEDILYEYFPPNVNISIDPCSGLKTTTGYYEKWADPGGPLSSGWAISYDFNVTDFTKVRVYDISIYKNGSHVQTDSWGGASSGSNSFGDSAIPGGWPDIVYDFEVQNKVNGVEMDVYDVSAAIKFVDPYFYGIVSDSVNYSNISDSDIQGLNKLIVPEQTNEIAFDVSTSYTKVKFVYAYPASYKNLKSIFDVKNDFNVTSSFDTSTRLVTMYSPWGPPTSYKVYIKSHWISFTPDVSIFKLIFNI
ncbi:MAG TPA: hypothetical protein PK122_01370 [Candidatus Paceibacterota bacterium]|nr:hypothetical protein [Candidatus Paceibacterota bacterium]